MRTVTFQDYKRRMLRVLVHIQQHLNSGLSLEELAGLACFSPCHFHRVFTGMVGESVKEYVRRLRLERAAGQLKLGEAPVTRIAFDAGYESHEAFTRSFRGAFGLSPSEYRASKKAYLDGARDLAINGGRERAPGPKTAPEPISPGRSKRQRIPRNLNTTRNGGKSMDVKIENRKAMRVAFMRHVGPYSKVGVTWDKLLPVLGKEGLLGGDMLCIGMCHDDPDVTPPDKLRYDACVTVDDTFVPQGEIGVQVIPGGDYAMTTHFGPYNKLGKTYTKLLGEWLPRSGRELRSSPCFEIYLNSPEGTEPGDLITDVYAPLEGGEFKVQSPKSEVRSPK